MKNIKMIMAASLVASTVSCGSAMAGNITLSLATKGIEAHCDAEGLAGQSQKNFTLNDTHSMHVQPNTGGLLQVHCSQIDNPGNPSINLASFWFMAPEDSNTAKYNNFHYESTYGNPMVSFSGSPYKTSAVITLNTK